MTLTTASQHTRSGPAARRSRSGWPVRLLALAAAAGTAVAGWLLWSLVAGVRLTSPDVGAGSFPVTPLGCVSAVLVSGGLGLAVAAVVERLSPRPRATWVVVAVLALLVSLAGPLTGTGVALVPRLALVTLHVLVAAAFVPGVAATLPSRRR